MIEELGAYPHNLANSSPVSWGDYLYVSTSNGQDESHVNIPSPRAPAIIAVDKKTGKVAWEDASPGDKILHGQWAAMTCRRDRRRDAGDPPAGRRLGALVRRQDRAEALGVRHEPQGLRLAQDAQRADRDPGRLRGARLHRQRPGPGARRGVGPLLRDRPDQARRHHADGPRLALRQDPALDLDGRDQGRHRLHRRLQRLPARARRQDGRRLLDPRHAGRGVGVAAARGRQGLPGRRGRRRRGAGRTARRRRCSPRTRSAARCTRAPCPRTGRS